MEIYGIAFTEGQLWLAAAAGSLLLVLIGQRLTRFNDKRNALRPAIHAFKSAFTDCASAIANDSFAIDTFARDFDRHRAAVDAIRTILPKRHQRKLQKAWNEYCGNGAGLGLDPQEYVQAFNAMLYSTNKGMFRELKNRFNTLHGCLDDLL